MTTKNGLNIGYIRVSTIVQNTDRQLNGVALDRIFEEKASAKDSKRPVLQDCMAFLRDGDTLHVHSIDRLARNLSDLLTIVTDLTANGVAIKFHKENMTFSGEADPMKELMLSMMGAFAQFERSLIKERQREGIAMAKAKGKHCGRKASLTDEQIQEIQDRIKSGDAKKALATEYGVSRQTIYNVIS